MVQLAPSPTAGRASSRAASSNGSRSPARWCSSPSSCSWTSRWAPSTSSCASRCSTRSSTCTSSLGVTVVYVTHDQSEALTMSDRVAVFNDGVIQQLATPDGSVRAAGEQPSSPSSSARTTRLFGKVEAIAGDRCTVEARRRLGDRRVPGQHRRSPGARTIALAPAGAGRDQPDRCRRRPQAVEAGSRSSSIWATASAPGSASAATTTSS